MIASFLLHAADLGYRLNEPLLADGKIHRVSWSPQSRDKSGWYVAWDHGDWGAVTWGDWRDDWKEDWTSKNFRAMSSTERAIMKAHSESQKLQEAESRAKALKDTSFLADQVWKNGCITLRDHPYLTKKQIPGTGMRFAERHGKPELLVPLRNEDGSLCNVQRILADGTKRFMRSAPIVGLHWRTGELPTTTEFTGDLIVAEGVATAATVHQISGATVFAAMNAGNLPAITTWLRRAYPTARILIAADDDRWDRDGTARPEEKNIGRKKATEAAANTRALILLPTWTDLQSRGTDWNDLYCEEGEPSATTKWNDALTVASLDRQISSLSESEYAQRRASLTAAYAKAGAGHLGIRQLNQRRKERRGASAEETDQDKDRPPILDLQLIVDDYELWKDPMGTAFCTMLNRGIRMNAHVEGQFFGDWLRFEYEERTGNRTPLPPLTLQSVTAHAAAKARTIGATHECYYRMGKCENYRWLDLGRDDWKCVRWNAQGWEIVDTASVKFFRGPSNVGLPIPLRDADKQGMDPLWQILNVQKEDRPLVTGFLLGAMRSDCSCFAMSIHGGHGCAKSMATELARSLLDPAVVKTQALDGMQPNDLGVTCINQWIPCFDNNGGISTELQNTLCMITTNYGSKTRKLYTNNETCDFNVRRPWIVNGMTNGCTRSDLAERTLPVRLNFINHQNRMTETEVRAKFKLVHAHLLAVILDAAVEAERHYEQTGIAMKKSGTSHRMADALQWITAGEDALGFAAGTFYSQLNIHQQESGVEALAGTPIMNTIEALLEEHSGRGEWSGTAAEFLEKLKEFAPSHHHHSKYLPHDERSLGKYFREQSARLKESFGIIISESIPNASRYGDFKRRRTIQKIETPQPI